MDRQDIREVVIFGASQSAELLWHCLVHESPLTPVAFTVESAFLVSESFRGLPVVPFERLAERFPPDRVGLIAPVGYHAANRLRKRIFETGRAMGYGFASFISPAAMVWDRSALGANVMVYDGVSLQPFATVGDNCILRTGAIVSHHATVGAHCFLAPRATLAGGVVLGERCFVGLSATVLSHVTVAPGCLIAAGALVTADTGPDGVYMGVPARRQAGEPEAVIARFLSRRRAGPVA